MLIKIFVYNNYGREKLIWAKAMFTSTLSKRNKKDRKKITLGYGIRTPATQLLCRVNWVTGISTSRPSIIYIYIYFFLTKCNNFGIFDRILCRPMIQKTNKIIQI